jgi:signal peptidase I
MGTNAPNNRDGFYKKLVTDTWLSNYARNGTGTLGMLSGSMAPLINTNDKIVITKADARRIAIGDIITFWKGDILVTHRVVRKTIKNRGLFFVERGDREPHHSSVSAALVVGKVVRIIKGAHTVDLQRLPWQAFNRIVGSVFFMLFVLRLAARRFPVLPQRIKTIINTMLSLVVKAKDRLLNTLFS